MLTEYYIANAITPCDCSRLSTAIEMRTTDFEEETGYPVRVFDVNLNEIGIAYSKSEYMTIWNASAVNTAAGWLSGNSGLFLFRFTKNAGPVPPYVYGNPLDAIEDEEDNIITEDEIDITKEDETDIVRE